MSYYTIPLLAGVPLTMDTPGRLILVDSPGVAGGVDIRIMRNGTPGPTMPMRKAAFRHVGEFSGVILTAAVDTIVGIFLSFDDVQLGIADGSAVSMPDGVKITNIDSEPIPVAFAGTVAPVFGTATIDNDNVGAVPVQQQALSMIVDQAAVVINTGAAHLLISDATYKRLRVKNEHATARIALGGAAVTMANGAIILEPGDMWIEDDAAGAAWYATSDTAGADVRVMGLK